MSANDRDEYESLETYRDYLMMVARWMIGLSYRGKVDAEELVNQALFEAFQQLGNYRGTTDLERMVWLKQILRNRVNDTIRYLHREKRNIDREQPLVVRDWDQSCSALMGISCGLTSPSVNAVKHEQELLLAAALSELPEEQRSAVELQFLHGCTVTEIAESMDCSVGEVGGLVRRGLKALKTKLRSKVDSE